MIKSAKFPDKRGIMWRRRGDGRTENGAKDKGEDVAEDQGAEGDPWAVVVMMLSSEMQNNMKTTQKCLEFYFIPFSCRN